MNWTMKRLLGKAKCSCDARFKILKSPVFHENANKNEDGTLRAT